MAMRPGTEESAPDVYSSREMWLSSSRALPLPGAEPTAGGMDLQQVWETLWAGRRFIITFGMLVFSGVMAVSLASRMTFGATGRLYLGELAQKRGSSGAGKGELDLSGNADSDISSEMAIITSDSLLRKAIVDSGLNVELARLGWEPPRFWRWRLSGRDRSLLDGARQELRAVATTLTEGARAQKRYRIAFRSGPHYAVYEEEAAAILAEGQLGETVALDGGELTLLAGEGGEPEAGAQFSLAITPIEQTVADVRENLNVSFPRPVTPGEVAKVVSLEFEHPSPFASASFLRVLMHAYLKERQDWKMEDATTAEDFVGKQLQAMRRSLDTTEERLADYRSVTTGVVLEGEAEAMVQQIAKYEEQRVAARLEIAALADLKRALNRPNTPIEAYLFGEASDSVLQGMAANLTELRQNLAELETKYQPTAPDVQERRQQVKALRDSIRRYVNSRLGRAQANLATFNRIIHDFQEKLETVPGAERGLAQLSRESEVYSRLYSYLLERQQQAAIVKASNVSKNRILDLPRPPMREQSPRLLFRLLAGCFGFLLAAALVLVRRLTASSVQSDSQARELAPALSIWAHVPPLPRGEATHPKEALAQDRYSGFAEAFRMLRTSLYGAGAAGRGRVVMVASPTPADGKTTCAMALAAMFAADRRRTLLIDADFRKPSHHERQGLTVAPGLSDVLAGRKHFAGAIRVVATPLGPFHAMPAGGQCDPELLSRENIADILAYARLHYDFIILDTAAFPMVVDALLLAPLSDCIITVLRLKATPRKLAQEHLHRLRGLAAHHGLVINGSGLDRSYGYAPSYYSASQSLAAPARYPRLRRALRLAAGTCVFGVAWLAAVPDFASPMQRHPDPATNLGPRTQASAEESQSLKPVVSMPAPRSPASGPAAVVTVTAGPADAADSQNADDAENPADSQNADDAKNAGEAKDAQSSTATSEAALKKPELAAADARADQPANLEEAKKHGFAASTPSRAALRETARKQQARRPAQPAQAPATPAQATSPQTSTPLEPPTSAPAAASPNWAPASPRPADPWQQPSDALPSKPRVRWDKPEDIPDNPF